MISIVPESTYSNLDEMKAALVALIKKKASRDRRILIAYIAIWTLLSALVVWRFGSRICTGWIAVSYLSFLISSVFYAFISEKSSLNSEIVQLKGEIRGEILKLVEVINIGRDARRKEMLEIEAAIKHKKKWRADFDEFPEILERNRKLDRESENEFRKILSNLGELGSVDRMIYQRDYELNSSAGYSKYLWLRERLNQILEWESPEYVPRTRIARPSDFPPLEAEAKETSAIEKSGSRQKAESPGEEPSKRSLETARTTARPAKPETGDNDSRNIQLASDLLEGNPENSLAPPEQRKVNIDRRTEEVTGIPQPQEPIQISQIPLSEVPRQRTRSLSYKKIKLSDDARRQIDALKAEIGRLGEEAAIEFEKLRLASNVETRPKTPIHVSLLDDARGYDIKSWDDSKEIFIEVKTTVGDFWSNLFFTANEKETMELIGEQYYLYRICYFDREKCEGQLFIYAGATLIKDTFEFNSNRFILTQKRASVED